VADDEPSTARILAYMMIDGMPNAATNEDKALRLSLVGFSNQAISEMLGISVASVASTLYSARKKATRKAPAKKKG
jgi:DNA-directed RNA polymerase specialized sigma24 family protein